MSSVTSASACLYIFRTNTAIQIANTHISPDSQRYETLSSFHRSWYVCLRKHDTKFFPINTNTLTAYCCWNLRLCASYVCVAHYRNKRFELAKFAKLPKFNECEGYSVIADLHTVRLLLESLLQFTNERWNIVRWSELVVKMIYYQTHHNPLSQKIKLNLFSNSGIFSIKIYLPEFWLALHHQNI